MRVHNIRLGHACNSSSTHSIVPLALLGSAHDSYTPGDFGWSEFMLASPEAKMSYLAATLAELDVDSKRISELTGVEGETRGYDGDFGYVDHQSRMALPVEGPHADLFLHDLAEYLRRDDVVVLGGNDNGGRDTLAHLPLPLEANPPKLRPETAPDGSRYWTVMSGSRGDRIRFSFDGQPLSGGGESGEYADYGSYPATVAEPLGVLYSNLPELVDVKVTGFCPFERDCPFCYMDSNTQGEHADWDTASGWLEAFGKAEVFELALGGGEPTLWPYLRQFIDRARELDINVNLTTKNLAWIKPENLKGLSAIAVSINNRRDLDRFADIDLQELRKSITYPYPEITVQCVPAFCDDDLLRDLIKAAKERLLRVTFLGVKRTGRAVEEERKDDLRWLDAIKPYRQDYWLQRGVAVDTLMAAASKDAFEELKVDPVWYETTEGKFSCYVDATTQKLGVSSYVDAGEMVACVPEGFVDGFQRAQMIAGVRPAP